LTTVGLFVVTGALIALGAAAQLAKKPKPVPVRAKGSRRPLKRMAVVLMALSIPALGLVVAPYLS
jgi:hypothetical protein